MSAGRKERVTLVLAVVTALVLAASVPGSLREAWERGGFYIFSREFLLDLPKRLFGPGRFRFLLQPAVAAVLGVAAGRADARTGRPPYLYGLLLGGEHRGHLVRSALGDVANLLLMGILLDSVCQWLILGASYPGAALVIGPVLIAGPYAVARALANRVTTAREGGVAASSAPPGVAARPQEGRDAGGAGDTDGEGPELGVVVRGREEPDLRTR